MASFEDPAGGEAIVVRKKIWPNMAKTTIESPPLRCVVKDRPYKVSITIEGPDGAVMQTIETTMASSEDQACCRTGRWSSGRSTRPIPELAGHPGGKLADHRRAALPAWRFPPPAAAGANMLDRIVRRRLALILLRRSSRRLAERCSFRTACDFV